MSASLEGMEGPGEQSLREHLLGLPHSGQPCPLFLLHGARSPLSPPQVTTDLRHRCTAKHAGTSASAPLAAGMVALALEAK